MDTPGEDSGFGYEDPSNLLEEGSQNVNYQIPNTDEPDEGIEINPFLVTPEQPVMPVMPGQLPVIGDGQVQIGAGAIIPPHIQLQLAQAEFQQMQQFMEDNPDPAVQNENFLFENQNNLNEEVMLQQLQQPPEEVLLQQLQQPPGDDNNNDRPDDVNNNTTDPNLRQQQQLLLEQQLQLQQQQLQQQHQQMQQQLQDELQQQLELELQQQQQHQEGDSQSEVRFVEVILDDPKDNGNDIELLTNGDSKDKKDKRKKKKKKKKNRALMNGDVAIKKENDETDSRPRNEDQDENEQPDIDIKVEVEYVPEKLELSVFDPMYKAFANVFENFRISDSSLRGKQSEDARLAAEEAALSLKKVPKIDLDDDGDEKKEDEKPKLSKRKLKKLTRLSVAELKQVVPRPDVVEMHDVTAKDPKLLVHLKAYRNTVPVPRHWCYKRKYLQGKRGIEKAPFDLPGFIKKTGIMEMRAALAEKEDQKSLKAKMRERVRPKMGKIDIDYQKLHDAFFKWQTKPKMTIHGDLYYEGKEFETRMKDKKPGELSDDLRTALGMPIGPNANKVPPPWLIAMQRYGPPPSYPHLKIPGLNAPIPDGCSFGYHAGGWGKPPVDEYGRPLYGDVFGIMSSDPSGASEEEFVDKARWGELESEEEEESSEEEEEEDEKEEEEANEAAEESGIQTPAEGLATPSGFSSVPAGLETPELIELRKRRIEQDMEGGETPALYTVLPEKRVDRISGAMMASTHVYDISTAKEKSKPFGVKDASSVELALDPSELDLVDTAAMEARYEQTLKEKQAYNQGEDLSDMVAEHTAKQKNKRKRQMQQQDVKKGAKKQKEFKF